MTRQVRGWSLRGQGITTNVASEARAWMLSPCAPSFIGPWLREFMCAPPRRACPRKPDGRRGLARRCHASSGTHQMTARHTRAESHGEAPARPGRVSGRPDAGGPSPTFRERC